MIKLRVILQIENQHLVNDFSTFINIMMWCEISGSLIGVVTDSLLIIAK